MQTVKINRQKEKSNNNKTEDENWEYIEMPDNICNLESELSQYVFLLITRLSFLDDNNKYNDNQTQKENNCWSEASYESNIKKYNIFSIPFLFDFINLYYESNKKIVSEILSRLIKIHPNFIENMQQSVKLTEKISAMLVAQADKLPILLMSADSQFQQLLSALEEVIHVYAVLLEHVNPSMKNILFGEATFINSIIHLYQIWCATPNENVNKDSNDVYHAIIQSFKKSVLNLVFIYIKLDFIDELQTKNEKEIKSLASELRNFLIEILDITTLDPEDDVIKKSTYMENSFFIVDFDVTYGLVDELKELENKYNNVSFKDTIKNIEFILSQSDNQDTRGSLNQNQGISNAADDDYINRTVLISQVQELFPDLGDGFIDQCLEALNNNPETVIAKLLDDDLPASVKNVNRSTKRKRITVKIPSEFSNPLPSQLEIMAEEDNKKVTIDDILKERRNIFDNDEFDILRNGKIDMNKVILGKKNRGTFEKEFDDKSKVNKEQIKTIVNHYDMYDDEYDDTWDGINEFNVNIDNNDDDKDKDAEGDEPEKPTKQNNAGNSSDPGIANKSVLMKWLESHPDVFLRNNRKSKHRKQLIDETGMSNEQIEGWYTMYQRNKKKREEAKNKSKGNKNTNSQTTTPTPQESSGDTENKSNNNTNSNNHSRNNTSNSNASIKNSNNNNNNNNHNRSRSNRNNNGGSNNNNNNNNNNSNNNRNRNQNQNQNQNRNRGNNKEDNDKAGSSNVDTKDNDNNTHNNNNNSGGGSNRRNNNKGGNKSKNRDGEKGGNTSSEKSNKPHNKKRSDADNHYRKAGRQRKLNFMMGGFE